MWTAGQGSHQILDPYFELLLGPSLDDGVATNLSREKGQLLWDASVCQPLKPTLRRPEVGWGRDSTLPKPGRKLPEFILIILVKFAIIIVSMAVP